MAWSMGTHSTCRGLPAGTVQCDLVRQLFTIVGLLLLVVGTVGNALGFAVVGSARYRHSSTAVFVRALAIADSAATWVGLGRHVTAAAFGVDIRELHPASCKAHLLLVYSAMDASAWILVCISIERFLAVCRPSSGRIALRVTRKWALTCCAVVVVCALSFNCHVIWTRGENRTTASDVQEEMELVEAASAADYPALTIEDERSASTFSPAGAINATGAPRALRRLKCGYTDDAAGRFWGRYQRWLAIGFGCVFPFIVMLTLTILIVRRLRKRAFQLRTWSSKMSHDSAASRSSCFSAGGEQEHRSLTRMLLSASVFFLVITAPAFLFNMIEGMFVSPEQLDSASHANLKIADTVTALLHYLSYAVNFYIYLATGRGFRSDVRKYLHTIKDTCCSGNSSSCCRCRCRPPHVEAAGDADAAATTAAHI